jgi:autotransporter-associated beta strand protein
LSIPSGTANAAYVLINNPVVAMTGANPWTIAMWVKTTTAGGVYAYQGSGGWASGNMTFYLNEGSDNGYGTKAGGVSYAQGWEEGSTNINDGNWHFLVMTCNGSTKAMYVDGNGDNIASSWAANTGVGSQLWIGGSADTGDEDVGLGGTIDEVYMYNRALSQAEIKSLYGKNSTGTPVLPATTAVTVAAGATLDNNGLSQTIGSLAGAGNVILGDDAAAVGNFTVGNANNTTFGGSISDAGLCSITKAGAGTLAFAGVNTYAGTNFVQSGALLINGSSASAVTMVSNNATLGGNGTVGGTVIVQSGGWLAPGASAGVIGTLTLSNAPALNGATLMKINRNNGAFLNDQIKVPAKALTYGGMLTVTNLGAPLQSGDVFQLFAAASYGGVFAATNLPALTSGLAWTNSLAANGRLAVFTAVSLASTNLMWSVSGTNLMLSWPSDHTGWRLLIQTNHLANGLSVNSNDWTTVANSSSTNAVTVPLNPALPDEFYRLIYP